jgi:hypothetical protein
LIWEVTGRGCKRKIRAASKSCNGWEIDLFNHMELFRKRFRLQLMMTRCIIYSQQEGIAMMIWEGSKWYPKWYLRHYRLLLIFMLKLGNNLEAFRKKLPN